MRPKTKDNYLGIEVECFSSLNKTEIAQHLKTLNLKSHVVIGHDTSLKCSCPTKYETFYDSFFGYRQREVLCKIHKNYEFKVLVKEQELYQITSKLNIFFKAIKAEVNDTCGLHVHLDMRNRPVLACVNNLYLAQDILYSSIPKKRRTSQYCRKSKNYAYLMGDHHYAGINFLNAYNYHKTVEVRMHEGTVDAKAIYNWAKLLIKIITTKINDPVSSTKLFPKPIKRYIDSRIRENNA